MKKILYSILFFVLLFTARPLIYSHCEVPCGIYNDEMRFTMMSEHILTIEKAMQQIMLLSKESPQNMNQIVRWVTNKEKHAEDLQHIISQYFLTQRIKSPESEGKQAAETYVQKLTLCHQILVYAMKAKQTTDMENVERLKSTVAQFKKSYFDK